MLNYCIVKQRIGAITEDTPDDDDRYPDYTSVFGQVVFAPNMANGSAYKITDDDGVVHTVPATRITGQIINGEISHEGVPGLPLFAAGPNANPSTIVYTATYSNMTAAGRPVNLNSITFRAIPGETIDLSSYTPVAGTPTPGIIQGPPGNTPYIGENGNWWISSKDTGAVATSPIVHSYTELREAFEENTLRVETLEAMGGLTPESPLDGQTANLIAQPDTLTRHAIDEALSLTAEWDDDQLKILDTVSPPLTGPQGPPGTPGIIGHFSSTQPTQSHIDGQPVIWFRDAVNFIPEIVNTTWIFDGLTVSVIVDAYDPDGDDVVIHVDWGAGPTTSLTHTYTTGGYKTPTVMAIDVWGAVESVTQNIYLMPTIPNRWAFESFNRPDDTALAAWGEDDLALPGLLTEVGGLEWRPGDASTGVIAASRKVITMGGWAVQGNPTATVDSTQQGSATLEVPASAYRISSRYSAAQASTDSGLNRVSFFMACTPVESRLDSEVTALAVRIGRSRTLEIFSLVNGSYERLGIVSPIPWSGAFESTLDHLGNVTISIDGELQWEGNYDGTLHPKIGIELRGTAAIDTLEVGPL